MHTPYSVAIFSLFAGLKGDTGHAFEVWQGNTLVFRGSRWFKTTRAAERAADAFIAGLENPADESRLGY